MLKTGKLSGKVERRCQGTRGLGQTGGRHGGTQAQEGEVLQCWHPLTRPPSLGGQAPPVLRLSLPSPGLAGACSNGKQKAQQHWNLNTDGESSKREGGEEREGSLTTFKQVVQRAKRGNRATPATLLGPDLLPIGRALMLGWEEVQPQNQLGPSKELKPLGRISNTKACGLCCSHTERLTAKRVPNIPPNRLRPLPKPRYLCPRY